MPFSAHFQAHPFLIKIRFVFSFHITLKIDIKFDKLPKTFYVHLSLSSKVILFQDSLLLLDELFNQKLD